MKQKKITPVYTYSAQVPGMQPENHTKLLLLWRKNWEWAGYEPIVLNEYIAQEHPKYQEFVLRITELPNINPPGYERACYMRWLAMAQVGGGLMTDHDLFIYDRDFQFNVRGARPMVITSYQAHTPCLVNGSHPAYEKAVEEIMAYKVSEKDIEEGTQRPHVSDMYMLYRGGVKFDSKEKVKNFGEEGWAGAPFVHYSSSSCKAGDRMPRHAHIEKLRRWG